MAQEFIYEKYGVDSGSDEGIKAGRRLPKRHRRICSLIALFLICCAVYLARQNTAVVSKFFSINKINRVGAWPKKTDEVRHRSFSEIPPSPELELHPCGSNNLCARLQVPLDWNSTDENEKQKAVIAIALRKAKVEVTDPRYGGPLFWNPGGPGGAVTDLHPFAAPSLQQIVDTPDEKYFDILSFDPRGVGNTEPRVEGIEERIERHVWQLNTAAVGTDMSDNYTFNNLWARYKTYGQSLVQQHEKSNSNRNHEASFVTTTTVVRDMVEILEQYGRWREKTARDILRGRGEMHDTTILERTRYRPGEEKLNYWGLSYGTVIGQTFAVLQPHRVQRMVLDGTVDLRDYTAGQWRTNLQDADRAVAAFASACLEAGPSKCATVKWAPTGHVATWLRRFYNLMEELKHEPFATIDSRTGIPLVTDYSDILRLLANVVEVPTPGFAVMDQVLYAISERNATLFSRSFEFQCGGPRKTPDRVAATSAIICSDAEAMFNTTKGEYLSYIDDLRLQSPLFADYLATIRMPCHGYTLRPKWRFEGPFGAQTPVGILFADQSLDPITPLRNGENAARLFPGAGVLEAKGVGHCSLSMLNLCALRAIKHYFANGKTQPEKIVCDQEYNPFDNPPVPTGNSVTETADFRELHLAGSDVQAQWAAFKTEFLNLGMPL